MVLENLISENNFKQIKLRILIVSFVYTIFAILMSFFFFNNLNISFVTLSFISLFILSTFGNMFKLSISPEISKFNKNIKLSLMFYELRKKLIIFLMIFFGVFLGFVIFSFTTPIEYNANFFSAQSDLIYTEDVSNMYKNMNLETLFINNLQIILLSILTSFLFGIGTVFLYLIIWNASVAAIIFMEVSKSSSLLYDLNFLIIFLIIFFSVLPHLILEIISYLLGGLIGENFSSYVVAKKPSGFKYKKIIFFTASLFTYALLILFLGALIEVYLPNNMIVFLLNLFI